MNKSNRVGFHLSDAAPPPDPSTAYMGKLRQAFFNSVNENDIKEIADGLVKRAKEGDVAATKLLLSYVCPQPSVSIGIRGSAAPPEPDFIDEVGTSAPPGSPEKIEQMRSRAQRKIGCTSPRDRNGHGDLR